MISGFGGHYRLYRLVAALDRLRALPPGSQLPLTKAAHLLGVSETQLRQLVQRHVPGSKLDGKMIGVATLQHALRQEREAQKRRS